MLRELPSRKPGIGEPKRRWFFCHDLDLVVWLDNDENPVAFQLAYDKDRNEHSISWRAEKGFQHFKVDDGNPFAGKTQTPLLHANGVFHPGPLIDQFKSLSGEMPAPLASFVIAKLQAYLAA